MQSIKSKQKELDPGMNMTTNQKNIVAERFTQALAPTSKKTRSSGKLQRNGLARDHQTQGELATQEKINEGTDEIIAEHSELRPITKEHESMAKQTSNIEGPTQHLGEEQVLRSVEVQDSQLSINQMIIEPTHNRTT